MVGQSSQTCLHNPRNEVGRGRFACLHMTACPLIHACLLGTMATTDLNISPLSILRYTRPDDKPFNPSTRSDSSTILANGHVTDPLESLGRYWNSNSKALAAHAFAWHQSNADGANKDPSSCQIERAVGALFKENCPDLGRHDTEQSTPEAGYTASRPADRGWISLGRPAVQDSIEHALEEVFHDVDPHVGSLRVDGRKDEERGPHQCRRHNHAQLPPDQRNPVHQRPRQHARDTADVDDDIIAVGRRRRYLDFTPFVQQNLGQKRAYRANPQYVPCWAYRSSNTYLRY